MKSYLFVLCLCLFIVQGCFKRNTQKLTEAEKNAVSAEIKASVENYRSAFMSLDGETMKGFNANVEGYTCAGDGAFIGYEEYMKQIEQFVKTTQKVNYVEIEDMNVIVLAHDAASCAIKYRWSITTLTEETINATGSWVYVFKKINNKWQFVHTVGSHKYSVESP